MESPLSQIMFKKEIKALKRLNEYDDIVKIYYTYPEYEYKGKKYGAILLEYIDGQNLEEFDLSEASNIDKYNLCIKIISAIQHAHNNNIIHRDIKPLNIMIQDGNVKIIDFGISKIKKITEKETTMLMITENYSAPELSNCQPATEKSDIYSVGAVIFKIFTGIEPSSNEVIANGLIKGNISDDVQKVLLKMLNPNPQDRIDNLEECKKVFEMVMHNLNVNQYLIGFNIGYNIFDKLKKKHYISKKETMNQFLSVTLPKEFKEIYAFYDQGKKEYSFIGESIILRCIYEKDYFAAFDAEVLDLNNRVRLTRKYIRLATSMKFFADSRIINNNCKQICTIIQDHVEEYNSQINKMNIFNMLFDKWKQYLNDCIDTTRERVGKLYYSDFNITDDIVTLTLEDYVNNKVDNLDESVSYIFEDETGKSMVLGEFKEAIFDEEGTNILIKKNKGISNSQIEEYLQDREYIDENYIYKSSQYRKQLFAIRALEKDNYESKNLKDIILDIQNATSTRNVEPIELNDNKINDSQMRAIDKALEADEVCLIQGPPGTGKTKVISKIISQIMKQANNEDEDKKILIVSQSNPAVDNIIEAIQKDNITSSILRIGNDSMKISPLVKEKYTVDAIKKKTEGAIKQKGITYLKQKLNKNGYDINTLSKNSTDEEILRWSQIQDIQKEWFERSSGRDELDYQIINNTTIIAGTCIGFVSNEYIRDMTFDYVIVDEAAKATTPELLVSIIKANKIVLVGDQNQLPPFSDESMSSLAKELAKNPDYRLFDILFQCLPDTNKEILSTQYRMKRNIGDLISKVFYDGKIDTGIADEERMHNIDFLGNYSIVWYDTSRLPNKGEDKQKGTSYYNSCEINVIRDVLLKLDEHCDEKGLDIGVITGYRAQKERLIKVVNNAEYKNLDKRFIDINTLDAFQGRENDIIIYSTVKTEGSIGFQKEKERINVAFSRARKLLIICGDMVFFEMWGKEENKFTEVIDYIRTNKDECLIETLRERIE